MTQYIGVARYQSSQLKAVSGTTATFTTAIGTGVQKAMLSATIDICFRQGTGTLTAVVADTVVYASSPMHITVAAGESIAVIARDGTSTGTAYLSEAV